MDTAAAETADSSNHGSPAAAIIVSSMGTMAQSTESIAEAIQTSTAQSPASQTYITMTSTQPTTGDASAATLMQPPMTLPFVMPGYQMLLPTQALLQQQAAQNQPGSPAQQATGSPAGTPGSAESTPRSGTPQQQTALAATYQQQPQLTQDSHAKSDTTVSDYSDKVSQSPARQGSVGSGGSPAPPTPGSLGSPLPGMMPDGVTQVSLPLQVPIQYSYSAPAVEQAQAVQAKKTLTLTKEQQEKNLQTLKPPKKPLTPYMRFSKAVSFSFKYFLNMSYSCYLLCDNVSKDLCYVLSSNCFLMFLALLIHIWGFLWPWKMKFSWKFVTCILFFPVAYVMCKVDGVHD